MKPQNKLGGKLDNIKNKVAYESSKKVSDIARVKKKEVDETVQSQEKQIKSLTQRVDSLLTKIQVIEQANENKIKALEQVLMSQVQKDNVIKKQITRIKALELVLTFYKEGNHYEKGIMGDKIVDKGKKASEVLDG